MDGLNSFGHLNASYLAAGEEPGLRRLCLDFYEEMKTIPEAKHILSMHREDLAILTDKLCLFLCGWLGGPRKFQEKYGPISIPMVHQHLVINDSERDAWLLCMRRALEKQPYSQEFKDYLNRQFYIPAERIRQTSRFE